MRINELIRKYTIAAFKVDGAYAKIASKLGLNESDITLFYALFPNYELSQKRICKEWQIPKSTLNTALKKYQKLGYLELVYLPNNKKEMNVKLTEEGVFYIKPYLTIIFNAEEKAMKEVLDNYKLDFVKACELYADSITEAFNKLEVKNE